MGRASFLAGVIVGVALLLGSAAPSWAKLYKYTDKSGNVHIVDSPMKIPPQYHDQLAPEDRPDPATGTVPDKGDSDSSLPVYKSISPPPASAGSDPAPTSEERRESLREKKRDNCQVSIERLEARRKDLEARYEKWASEERKKGKIGDEPNWISCSSGDGRACIENNRKMRREREEKLLKSSPYHAEFRTLEAIQKQLERRCRD